MSFALAPYQETAVKGTLIEIREAQAGYDDRGKKTAIGLAAPTGAGKTVIATAALERLLLGDDDHEPNRNLAVLWVTDDPSLNRQTLNKMLEASSSFTDSDFVEIGSGFDEPYLQPGRIHFAHIHLFFKNTTSMQPSDTRENGLWDIIANSVTKYGSNFLLIVDEAHRGTGMDSREQSTTVGRLIHGSNGKPHFTNKTHPPAPVVLGISATPERFRESMDRAGRSLEDVIVPVADVRESGLLKDQIVVYHPGEEQPSEDTLLVEAVKALQKVDEAWKEYAEKVEPRLVTPLLVIQVKPAVKDSDLVQILTTLKSTWPVLSGDSVAHAFDSHATLRVGKSGSEFEVPYMAPDRIAGSTHVRAVLFKSALTTGWDCPRAEVMLSLRSSNDATAIAQLIGRMVRTPLAERVTSEEVDTELLNSVTLYLPHYDRDGVAKVIKALSDETGDGPDITIDPIECVRDKGIDNECWTLLGELPSAQQRRDGWRSETHRLLGLAKLLRENKLVKDAVAQVQKRLVGAIETEVGVHSTEIAKLTEDVASLAVPKTVFDSRHGMITEDGEPDVVTATAVDIDVQYKTAVRKLPDASAKWYFAALCADDDTDTTEAKAQVAALTKTKEMETIFKEAVEDAATKQIESWRSKYANEVARLSKEVQGKFQSAWHPKLGTVPTNIEVPDTVLAKSETATVDAGGKVTVTKVDTWPKHLYVAAKKEKGVEPGMFPAALTGWEKRVLQHELSYDSLAGWYRNPSSGKHGLAVPYQAGDRWRLMYPDFIFFHNSDDGVVLDIVDPHRHNEADTGAKWSALAAWSQEPDVPAALRRVVGVIEVDGSLLSLDLRKPEVVGLLAGCGGKDEIEALFDAHGGSY